jgi:hypothetical protein
VWAQAPVRCARAGKAHRSDAERFESVDLHHATCNRQHTTCSRQQATWQQTRNNMQQITCSRQQTTCSRQHATENMQQTRNNVQQIACNVQHRRENMQQTTCNREERTCNRQQKHATCNMQHATDTMRHATATADGKQTEAAAPHLRTAQHGIGMPPARVAGTPRPTGKRANGQTGKRICATGSGTRKRRGGFVSGPSWVRPTYLGPHLR